MNWNRLSYAVLCIVVPVAWGLIVYWASSMIEKRVLRRSPSANGNNKNPADDDETTLPLDYHI